MNKITLYLFSILVILGILWLAYGYLSVRNIEEPKYQTLHSSDPFEIRTYDPYITASVEVSGEYKKAANQGFRLIANYIFGNNQSQASIAMTAPVIQAPSQRIAMTAPVVQEKKDNQYVISFIMPRHYTLDTLPHPKNSQVVLKKVPARKVAVIRFSGLFSQKRADDKKRELIQWLKGQGMNHTNQAQYSRYNPPGTPPFMNRHEVWIDLNTDSRN